MQNHPGHSAEARIVTLTLNPAVDVTTHLDVVRDTEKLRCGPARHDPGGGGINVARVAAALGSPATAVFPIGGINGQRLAELLKREPVHQRRVLVGGDTRESFTVNETSTDRQFRFVMPGPTLSARDVAACIETLADAACGADFVVASGSLPPGAPEDSYQLVSELCRELGVSFILDTSGAGLTHLRSGVHLLKASLRELRDYTGRPLTTDDEQLDAAHDLIDSGCATSVLVSRGASDALLATPNDSQRFAASTVAAGSGVGAGDALVAGLVVGLARAWSLPTAIRFGMAAGAAMLLTPGTATCREQDVRRMYAAAELPTASSGHP